MLLGSYAGSTAGGGEDAGSTRKGSALGADLVGQEGPEGLELVELPSGRIVLAASEEGRAAATAAAANTSQRAVDGEGDEVRRLWSDMRLSEKARSKSPSERVRQMAGVQ